MLSAAASVGKSLAAELAVGVTFDAGVSAAFDIGAELDVVVTAHAGYGSFREIVLVLARWVWAYELSGAQSCLAPFVTASIALCHDGGQISVNLCRHPTHRTCPRHAAQTNRLWELWAMIL